MAVLCRMCNMTYAEEGGLCVDCGEASIAAGVPVDTLPPTWQPISGGAAGETPRPSVLEVVDGVALMYDESINGVVGPSESLKTWMVLMAVREQLDNGTSVLYLDFEGSREGIVSRLRRMGVPDEALDNFWYAHPGEVLPERLRVELLDRLLEKCNPGLVVVDGWTELLALLDLEVNSNTDAAKVENRYLKPLCGDCRTVAVLHHVPHEGSRALGAQHFKSMITGSCIALSSEAPMDSRGRSVATVTILKDRHGGVRACFASKNVGEIYVEGRPEEPTVSVGVNLLRYTTSGRIVPTRAMQEAMVAAAVLWKERGEKGATMRMIRGRLTGFSNATREAAIKKLIYDRQLVAAGSYRGSVLYRPAFEQQSLK